MGIKSDISNKLVLGFGDYLKHYSSIVAKQHLWKSEIFLHIILREFCDNKISQTHIIQEIGLWLKNYCF